MIEKRGYVKFGIIGGFVTLLLVFLFEYIVLSFSGFIAIFAWIGVIPGDLILNIFTSADPTFLGVGLVVWISILFWFVIGFLLGMLVYKLYLIKNE